MRDWIFLWFHPDSLTYPTWPRSRILDRNLSSHLEVLKFAGKSRLLMTISKLHWRPAGWCCVELHFGTVLGDEFGPSSPHNSIAKTNPWCNSTQHKIDNFQKSHEYAIFIYYFGFHTIACVLATFFAPKGHFASAIKQMRFFLFSMHFWIRKQLPVISHWN